MLLSAHSRQFDQPARRACRAASAPGRELVAPTATAALLSRARFPLLLLLLFLLLQPGCSSANYLQVRREPRSPLEGQLQLLSRKGPQPTQRTASNLRRYALNLMHDEGKALSQLEEELLREPTSEKVYSYAELAYIAGHKAQQGGAPDKALHFFGASVAHAYMYLFDPRFNNERNPYDPQFRGACDLYNGALESALRIVSRQGKLVPGTNQTIKVGEQELGLTVELHGPWHADEFEKLEFVSDFEVKGLRNRHHSYGLGVPMIAVRRRHANEAVYEQYYPPGLSLPVTAFLRLRPGSSPGEPQRVCAVELHDSLARRDVQVSNYLIPLETDHSTALAYSLDHPDFQERKSIARAGFLDPQKTQRAAGLFMLEPYDPRKIPVIMVHGLLSSPLTWMEMFNDLRSFPDLRDRYQFWFYLYPTGQPFWVSARQFREELAEVQQNLDPHGRSPALAHKVLVGHSMGGLVSRLQVIDSGDRFWKIVSDKPFESIRGAPEETEDLRKTFFFQGNPTVRRVITLGTPYRGSDFANSYTRWLGRQFISLPNMLERARDLMQNNPDSFRNNELLTINTSIDSLAEDSPFLPVMREAPTAPWVHFHNVIGKIDDDAFVRKLSGDGDGIVSFASARLESAESEIVVKSEHTSIHRNPRAILEVRHILLQHLREYDGEIASRWQSPLSPNVARRPGLVPNDPNVSAPARE